MGWLMIKGFVLLNALHKLCLLMPSSAPGYFIDNFRGGSMLCTSCASPFKPTASKRGLHGKAAVHVIGDCIHLHFPRVGRRKARLHAVPQRKVLAPPLQQALDAHAHDFCAIFALYKRRYTASLTSKCFRQFTLINTDDRLYHHHHHHHHHHHRALS
jgi:hypothetical protein